MITAWDPDRRALRPAGLDDDAPWIHATAPTPEEQRTLVERCGIPAGFLRHALDVDELARVDHDPGGHRLLVLRVPWPRPDAPRREPPYRAAALGIVLYDARVVTVCGVPVDLPDALAAHEGLDPRRGHLFAVQAALVTAERFLIHLKAAEAQIDELEDQLRTSQANREVLELLRFQKGLVHFTTALASNQIMLERLRRDLAPDETEVLDDALVEIHQAMESTTVASNILGQMMDAFASIISNNLNVAMKALTALTIVLALPTVFSSLYGMNVALPLAGHPLAFWIIAAGSVVVAVGAAAALRWRRWL